MLPAVGEETGQTVTGIGSPGAKAAASDIRQKIGDVYRSNGDAECRKLLLLLLENNACDCLPVFRLQQEALALSSRMLTLLSFPLVTNELKGEQHLLLHLFLLM